MPRARDFLDRFRPIGTGGRRAVQSALLVIAVVMTLVPGSSSGAPPQPGTFRGGGFDACSAPPSTTMDAWLTSPYRAVGVYIGGANRHCAQIELTAAWVAHQQAAGWHLLPIYLGLQAPCTTSGKRYLMDPAHAAAQGRAEASAAVTAAHSLGMSPGTALIFDMEAYRPADAGCSRPVLAFLGAWTARLHDVGYLSGVYGSSARPSTIWSTTTTRSGGPIPTTSTSPGSMVVRASTAPRSPRPTGRHIAGSTSTAAAMMSPTGA